MRAWRGASYPSLLCTDPPSPSPGVDGDPSRISPSTPPSPLLTFQSAGKNVGSTPPSPPPLELGPTAARVVRTPIRCPRRVAGVMGRGAQVSPTPSHPSPSPQTDPTGWPDADDPDADADGEGNPTPTPDTRRRRGRSRVRRPKIFLRAPRKEGGEGGGKGKERKEKGGGRGEGGRGKGSVAPPQGRPAGCTDPDADADGVQKWWDPTPTTRTPTPTRKTAADPTPTACTHPDAGGDGEQSDACRATVGLEPTPTTRTPTPTGCKSPGIRRGRASAGPGGGKGASSEAQPTPQRRAQSAASVEASGVAVGGPLALLSPPDGVEGGAPSTRTGGRPGREVRRTAAEQSGLLQSSPDALLPRRPPPRGPSRAVAAASAPTVAVALASPTAKEMDPYSLAYRPPEQKEDTTPRTPRTARRL